MADPRLPPLPSLRTLTAELRALHDAWAHPDAGGEYVRLVCYEREEGPFEWRALASGLIEDAWVAYAYDPAPSAHVYGWEHIPGDGKPFDATAAARRLLAAARDALA